MSDRAQLLRRLTAPWLWLVVSLSATAALVVGPPRWTAGLKEWTARSLVPGQRAVAGAEASISRAARRWGLGMPRGDSSAAGTAANQAEANDTPADARLLQQVRQLEAEVRRLRIAAASVGREQSAGAATDPLLRSQLVAARVLGYQARHYLARRAMLDVGGDAGLENGAVVLDAGEASGPMPLLDLGSDTGLRAGRLVLSGRSVVGKLREVGRSTSTVERITDASFRDSVRLIHEEQGRAVPGPRGMLTGTGEPLCRIRLVEAREPVAVGDIVVCGSLEGIVDVPPRYGIVVRVEQAAGGPYWEIWMQPAASPRNPAEVAVLRTELSSIRVARRQ